MVLFSRMSPSTTLVLNKPNCVEVTIDYDEIKKINYPSIDVIILLNIPLTPHNEWLRGNIPFHLITLMNGLLLATTRWCNNLYFSLNAQIAWPVNRRRQWAFTGIKVPNKFSEKHLNEINNKAKEKFSVKGWHEAL